MAELGQLGAQTFRMSFPEQQLAQQEAQQLAVQPAAFNQPKDPLAYRGKLNRDYYTNYGLLESFVKEMAKQGIDVTAPDFSQPGGGELFQQYQILSAASMAAADALASEMKAEQQMRPLEAKGDVRRKPGVNQEGLYYSDQNNFYPTAIDPLTLEANKKLDNNFYTQGDVDAVNTAIRDPRVAVYKDLLNPNSPNYDPNNVEVNQRSLQALLEATKSTSPGQLIDRSGTGAPNAGISAYVTSMAQLAQGNGFEPGDRYDANGNRIDIARPANFVGRQLGFTPNGKKFIIDRLERTADPEGTFKVEFVDAQGNRVPLDSNDLSGPLRNFIETNEGAGALKELSRFFQSEGLNTAKQPVSAARYADAVKDITGQTSDAPRVQEIRQNIDKSLDALSSGGLGTWLKNSIASRVVGANIEVIPTDLKFKIPGGYELVVKKTGDNTFKIDNYKDIWGKPDKNGNVGGVPVKGNYTDISKDRLKEILTGLNVEGIKIQDKKGKEVDVPLDNRTPEELKAEELIRKYSQ